MISAAVVGLGRGRNLVEGTQGKTDKIRFTTAVVRSPDKSRDFARAQDLNLVTDYAYFGTFIATAEGWRMRESVG